MDPVTLTAIGVGLSGLVGAGNLATQLFGSQPKPPSMPAAPPPASTPTGGPKAAPANQPSFLAAAAAPPNSGSTGQKTLLGS